MANLTERAPLVLAVDDAHWADEPSLRFLLHLAHRLAGLPVVIALATRTGTEAHRPDLRSLVLEARAPVLRPRPLSEAAVENLVRASLGAGAGAQLCRACREATGGNPFLLSELLGELRRAGRPAGEIDPASVRRLAPDRIAAAVLLRVGRLDRRAPALARSVAVLGEQARLVTCARLAELDLALAHALADSLAELAVLERGEPLRFVHPIVRTAIYEEVPTAERAGMHARAARLLADQHANPGTIAVHLLATNPAGDREVVTVLRDAARRALAGGAPDTSSAPPSTSLARPRPAATCARPARRRRTPSCVPAPSSGSPGTPSAIRPTSGSSWRSTSAPRATCGRTIASSRWSSRRRGWAACCSTRPAAQVRGRGQEVPRPAWADPRRMHAAVLRRARSVGEGERRRGRRPRRTRDRPPALASHAGNFWRINTTFCLVAAERYDAAERMLARALRQAERTGSLYRFSALSWLRALSRHRRGDLRGAEADGRANAQNTWYTYGRITGLFPLIESLADQGRVDEGEVLLAENDLDGDLAPVLPSILVLVARGRLRAAGGDLSAPVPISSSRCG